MPGESFHHHQVIILTGPQFEELRKRADLRHLDFMALNLSGKPAGRITSDALTVLAGQEVEVPRKAIGPT